MILNYTVIILLGSIGRIFMKKRQVCNNNLIDFGDDSCKKESIKSGYQNERMVEHDFDGNGVCQNNDCEVYKYDKYPPFSSCIKTDDLNSSDNRSRKKLNKYKKKRLKGSKRKRKKEKKKKQWKRKRRK